jgi:hypothetical protein
VKYVKNREQGIESVFTKNLKLITLLSDPILPSEYTGTE